MFTRLLKLPKAPQRSFFLWGPRQTGKTYLLNHLYPDAFRIDLLKSDEFQLYNTKPAALREQLIALKHKPLVVIDEVQKAPMLLDEVHWLIENLGIIFILCGSSARKIKRSHANLLGGRALRYQMHGLVSAEIGPGLDILHLLNSGYLPLQYLDQDPVPGLRAYVADYLKQEIADEGLVRSLPSFSRFLEIAAISDTEFFVQNNIAQDCGVSSPTVKSYFQILEDTLLGSYLPAWIRKPKRRLAHAPKFYLADVGVVNILAKRGRLEWGAENTGKAFENLLYHELYSHSHYSGKHYNLSYWRLSSGEEVDFILGEMEIAIEVKQITSVSSYHLKGLREIKFDNPTIKRRLLVCRESRRRTTEDGIEIIPIVEFLQELWSDSII